MSYNSFLIKRDIWYSSPGSLGTARWAFFALSILVIIFLLFYTFRVNKKRVLVGRSPIRGTAWITPPSYFQSQTQYNQPRHDNYVPTYTETANDYDAGYYDAQGNFFPNPNKGVVVSDETGVGFPPHAHTNTGISNNFTGSSPIANFHRDFGNYYGDDLELGDIRRPSGAPPSEGTSGGYLPPSNPPPSHVKN